MGFMRLPGRTFGPGFSLRPTVAIPRLRSQHHLLLSLPVHFAAIVGAANWRDLPQVWTRRIIEGLLTSSAYQSVLTDLGSVEAW
jgi:hypothetical protein